MIVTTKRLFFREKEIYYSKGVYKAYNVYSSKEFYENSFIYAPYIPLQINSTYIPNNLKADLMKWYYKDNFFVKRLFFREKNIQLELK